MSNLKPQAQSSSYVRSAAEGSAKALGTGAIAVGATKLGLLVAGFATKGVVAGSIAAATQAGIGNVVAGSTFAVLQSAGAVGVSGLLVPVGLPAAAAYGGYKAYQWYYSK